MLSFLEEAFPLSLEIRKVTAYLGHVFTYDKMENSPHPSISRLMVGLLWLPGPGHYSSLHKLWSLSVH